jgi:hypothetical protein
MFDFKKLMTVVTAIGTVAVTSIISFNPFTQNTIANNNPVELTELASSKSAEVIPEVGKTTIDTRSAIKDSQEVAIQQPKPLQISTNPDGTIKLQLNKSLIPTIQTPSLPSISIGEPAEAGVLTAIRVGGKYVWMGVTFIVTVTEGKKTLDDSTRGDDIFIFPDDQPIEWNEASQICNRKYGRLIWRKNLKTCIKR